MQETKEKNDIVRATAGTGGQTAAGAMLAGGAAGAAMLHAKVDDFLRDNLEKQGAFDAVQHYLRSDLEQAAKNDAVQHYFEGEGVPNEVSRIGSQYHDACNKIIEQRGLNKWPARWRELESSQKGRAIVFAASTAVAVGAISYMAIDSLLNKKRDSTPAR